MKIMFKTVVVLTVAALAFSTGSVKAESTVSIDATSMDMYLISQVEWFFHPGMQRLFRNAFATTFARYSISASPCS